MSLNGSIVEDFAIEWFLLRSAPLNYGEQVGKQCRVAPTLIPAFFQREKGKEREEALHGGILHFQSHILS